MNENTVDSAVADFKNDYKTLYPWYMESIWWVFKQLFDKGLVYRGYKVMPFSTACNTPLSNFETTQNYKDVVDPAGKLWCENGFSSFKSLGDYLFRFLSVPVTVNFPIISKPGVSILAWTTTPWTLPSNLSLCVNPEHMYVQVEGKKFLSRTGGKVT